MTPVPCSSWAYLLIKMEIEDMMSQFMEEKKINAEMAEINGKMQ